LASKSDSGQAHPLSLNAQADRKKYFLFGIRELALVILTGILGSPCWQSVVTSSKKTSSACEGNVVRQF
jgi:hypothetical protein